MTQDYNDIYGSKFLAADADIEEDAPKALTITKVDAETVGKDKATGKEQTKLVVTFAEASKRMVLNKTNASIIAALYGQKSADWIGKRVTVYATDVQYGDEMVRGLRIKTKAPGAAAKATADTNQPPF